MAMKVQNNNDQGNPYHDDEGKFTTPGDSGSGGNDVESQKQPTNFASIPDGTQYSERDFLDLLEDYTDDDDDNTEKEKPTIGLVDDRKPVTEMTDVEIMAELKEHKKFLESENINAKKFFGKTFDIREKCLQARQFSNLIKKYDIGFDGCELIAFDRSTGKDANTCGATGPKYVTKSGFKYGYIAGEEVTDITNDHIEINAHYCHSFNSDEHRNRRQMNWGEFSSTASGMENAQTITHESGHALENNYFRKSGVIKEILKEANFSMLGKYFDPFVYVRRREEAGLRVRNEIEQIYMEKFGKTEKDFIAEISEYGKTSSLEWFAETFASLNCGAPTESALAMADWIEKNDLLR